MLERKNLKKNLEDKTRIFLRFLTLRWCPHFIASIMARLFLLHAIE